MSAQDFLSYFAQAIYLVLFVVAGVRLVRRPGWASLDTFLFFAVIAVLLLAGDAARLFGFQDHPTLNIVNWIGITLLPYVLLRLVDDFRPQPLLVMGSAAVAFALVGALGVAASQPWEPAITLIPIAFVVVLGLYASRAFLGEARSTQGVTRRRMQAVALGSSLLALLLLLVGVRVVFPATEDVVEVLIQATSLVLVLSYFVGFAPPAILRRAWQEPAIRAMLAQSAELVQLPDHDAMVRRIVERAAAVTGAEGAALATWDEASGYLVFGQNPAGLHVVRPGEYISGRAFEQQRPIYTGSAHRDAPEHAADYRARGIQAIAAAPITSGEHRLGVLVVYAARPPAFTDDVIELVSLMAEQAALVLRSRQLLQDAAQVRALAEMTRLKDDFLSVVAHDVRTPLTTILLNAELLQQHLARDGVNSRRAASLHGEAVRLKRLVDDYLDVVRVEQGRELRREDHDLVALVDEAIAGMGQEAARVRLSGERSVRGAFDGARITQLVQNLVSNALKYSGADDPVEVDVSADGDHAVLAVTDHGIGIPESDMALLFERFHRGANADDRRYAGLGLGLYICRQIAEDHGGGIEVSSRVGEGTSFRVRLARTPGAGAVPSAVAEGGS